jgi:hypothetical protein
VERAHITLTRGIFVGRAEDAPEQILSKLAEVSDRTGELVPENGMLQSAYELEKAGYQRKKGTT